MAIKPFEQVYPGQNAPDLKPKKDISPQEWERRQRMKEYRIAARREKRNRKSDEKQQRKLNATILRRMTRNPDKYTKNVDRNMTQAVEKERGKIRLAAVRMAQRLAAVYDPSGATFNVSPVVTLENGSVVAADVGERRKEREPEKAAARGGQITPNSRHDNQVNGATHASESSLQNGFMNIDRLRMIESQAHQSSTTKNLGKNQQNRQSAPPQASLPKPAIPDGINIPSDEEENWLELWDLTDAELERRILRAKKRNARQRKEFRQQQKSGKAERRAARDEKKRVYRDIKESWQVVRREERRRRNFLVAMENEERRRLAVQVNLKNRKDALDMAAALGFTLENVEGVKEIQPTAIRVNGVTIDINSPEYDRYLANDLKVTGCDKPHGKPRGNRVDLGAVPDESLVRSIAAEDHASGPEASVLGQQDFMSFGNYTDQDHQVEQINYNKKVRRKLRRAIEDANIKKEVLVRSRAIEYCNQNGLEVPAALKSAEKPISIRGQRTLPSGLLETDKQERTRAEVELAEFNRQIKVLRRQAKEMAVEAGIRVYLELTGRIPKREGLDEEVAKKEAEKYGHNGPAAVHDMTSVADLIASWPMPEEGLGQLEGAFEDDFSDIGDEEDGEDTPHDSATQLGADSSQKLKPAGNGGGSDSESEDDDSDEEDEMLDT